MSSYLRGLSVYIWPLTEKILITCKFKISMKKNPTVCIGVRKERKRCKGREELREGKGTEEKGKKGKEGKKEKGSGERGKERK